MYILQDELKLNEWQFSQRKYLPYEMKVKLAETRIREWYENWYGDVYKRQVISLPERCDARR